MKLYGLVASGRDIFLEERKSIISQNIFYTKNEAEEYKKEFLELCINRSSINSLDNKYEIDIRIVKFNIKDKI